ncbi:hypothetical protein PENSUB_11624 [Penicillium subrubescens]|uniref:Uncharacterized protein n=1 Tax=Penicillium subrubescens TaxID=1316194 RepID=A0A1Q5T282_9EURO|nr:hypothetical protein PENSUB_11624 [Penicillium subrubescens]
MTHPIHLAVFKNAARPAHWAIFVPTDKDGKVGNLIHVTGNPATGFFLDLSASTTSARPPASTTSSPSPKSMSVSLLPKPRMYHRDATLSPAIA